MVDDNFFSWMERTRGGEKVAMDEGTGFKHPDGSPCRAKDIRNCPYFQKAIKEEALIDDLDKNPIGHRRHNDELRHLSELKRIFEGEKETIADIPGCQSLAFADFEGAYEELREAMNSDTMKNVAPFPDARKRRDEVFAQHPDAEYETFDLKTGEKLPLESGWGVTFQTTETENKENSISYLSDADYDKKVAIVGKVLGSTPNVGVYEKTCEMSYCCQDTLKALAAMVLFEQKETYNYGLGVGIMNRTFDKKRNNLKRPQDK